MRIFNLLSLGLMAASVASATTVGSSVPSALPAEQSSQVESVQTQPVQPQTDVAQMPSEQPVQVQQQQPLPPPQGPQPMMQPQYAPASPMYSSPQYVQQPRPQFVPQPRPVAHPVQEPRKAPRADSLGVNSKKDYIHNGFFFELDLGVRYMRLQNKEYDDYFDEVNDELIIGDKGNSAQSRFKGYGPDFGLKFGGIISSRLALYCNVEFSSLDGNFKASRTVNGKKKSSADFETDAIRFAFGGGTHFFLTPNPNSLLYGTFIGASVSIVAEEAGLTSSYYDHEELEISKSDLSFGAQLGKVWMVNDAWNVGLTVKGSIDGGIRDGESGNDTDYYSLAANLVVIRK